jgi:hypothetical protein
MKTNYTKSELKSLPTIEQAWNGDFLKIQTKRKRVWLTHSENIAFDGDYQVETLTKSGWKLKNYCFNS